MAACISLLRTGDPSFPHFRISAHMGFRELSLLFYKHSNAEPGGSDRQKDYA
jgi:hypothetical protein